MGPRMKHNDKKGQTFVRIYENVGGRLWGTGGSRWDSRVEEHKPGRGQPRPSPGEEDSAACLFTVPT